MIVERTLTKNSPKLFLDNLDLRMSKKSLLPNLLFLIKNKKNCNLSSSFIIILVKRKKSFLHVHALYRQ